MSTKIYWYIIIFLIAPVHPVLSQFNFEDAFPNLPDFTFPVDLQNSGDCTNRIFVVEKEGIIKVFDNRTDVSEIKIFLDITDRVFIEDIEMGLLGLVFHPDYKNNGYFYVNYTAGDPRRTVISRFRVSSTNPDSADKQSEYEILTYLQPFHNHNGGWLGFGPVDGYLYISSGDGGPHPNGQMNDILLGKILRIDINEQDPGLNYSIPPDNPYFDSTGTERKEIYATGLRNPWRCSFDPETGLLWCGDVGSASIEEIDIIVSGGNYGWACYEGTMPWVPHECPDSTLLIFPVYEYPHSEGLSITGGYVYRGPNQPGLYGKYIYADWFSRKVWSLEYDGINPPANELIFTLPPGAMPTSFGVDEAGELYICTSSRLYKIIPTAPVTAPANLTAEAIEPSIVELNWIDNSGNEGGFLIERSDSAEKFQMVATVSENTVAYEDTVAALGEYQYRISAYNINDTSGYSNIACVSVLVVSVDVELIAMDYFIEQNFPNPFNPITSVRFNIPEESIVRILVVNVLGEVVAELVDEIKPSGIHSQTWNAINVSSGIYFLRMNAQSVVSGKNYSQTIKTVLMK